MMQVYLDRVVEQLHVWHRNIVQCEATEEPTPDPEGRLYTPGAVDLFRILNEQVSIISGFTRGDMVLQIAQVVVKLAENFQQEQQPHSDSHAFATYTKKSWLIDFATERGFRSATEARLPMFN